MRAIDAAVLVLEREGVTVAFGVPGAAINPLYSALKARGSITHILARHVEAASHMAEGYTRATAGNIGVCIGTSGPAGTDMITGLYSAQADSIPILCITGQAPRARLHKEDFQAVDIAAIARPVAKWATTVLEPAQVPGAFQQAFHLMRSGRPGPVLLDLPVDVQVAEIEFDADTYSPLAVYKPAATRAQIEKALAMLNDAQRPVIVSGGGRRQRGRIAAAGRIRRNHRSAGNSHPDGVGKHSRRPSFDGRDVRPANVTSLWQRDDARVRFRAGYRQQMGKPTHGFH
jgi:tartronate-semialdehyde synthase